METCGLRKRSECVPTRDCIPKVFPLKLFLDMVTSSSADVARALRGCFREGSVYLSFRFVSKRRTSESERCGDVFFDILITDKGASAIAMF